MTAAAASTVEIDASSARLRHLSQQLWSHPELGRQEQKAHTALTTFLEESGFHVRRAFPSPTAFFASSSPEPARPHVVLLCEYDALPGIGHACGHNLIAGSGAGAGVGVLAAMRACGLGGRVSVLGTPAEENDGGKLDFIEAGLLDDVDAAIMAHPIGGQMNMLTTAFNASSNWRVKFTGKASHAASNPWEAVNALDAAVQTYQNVANLRQHIPTAWRVAGVITDGGNVPNVIPERSEMLFTLRTPSDNEMRQLEGRWRKCVEAATIATGCTMSMELKSRPYMDMINNWRLAEAYERHATTAGVPLQRMYVDFGSTDMGNVSHVVPSIHPQFQIGSQYCCHEAAFAADAGTETAQDTMLVQAKLMALTALDVLQDEVLRDAMWKEFDTRNGGPAVSQSVL